jgi:hypothetical protein
MRLVVSVLACVGVGGMSLALADPPANPAPATPATAQPAASAPVPAAKAQTPTVDVDAQKDDQLEKHFLAEGYKLEMHNGQKYFCRREEELGSRLGAQKQCATAQQLKSNEDESRAAVERGRMQQTNPASH